MVAASRAVQPPAPATRSPIRPRLASDALMLPVPCMVSAVGDGNSRAQLDVVVAPLNPACAPMLRDESPLETVKLVRLPSQFRLAFRKCSIGGGVTDDRSSALPRHVRWRSSSPLPVISRVALVQLACLGVQPRRLQSGVGARRRTDARARSGDQRFSNPRRSCWIRQNASLFRRLTIISWRHQTAERGLTRQRDEVSIIVDFHAAAARLRWVDSCRRSKNAENGVGFERARIERGWRMSCYPNDFHRVRKRSGAHQ